MKIGGLRQLSLLDFPGRVACTVFLSGCNLRCPYCHNPSLVLPSDEPEALSQQALLAFLDTRRGKLDGVCISGGEPTLHKELPQLLRCIRERGFLTKLDTNGTDPAMLAALLEYGKHGQAAKPFMTPAKRSAQKPCIEAMRKIFEEGVDSL